MTYEQLASTIRTRFKTELQQQENLQVYYDNQPDQDRDRPNAPWIRFSVRMGEAAHAQIGGALHRINGVGIAQVFVPIQGGDQEAYEITDKIVAVFRVPGVDDVRYSEPTVQVIGRSEGYWQINVTCPFQHDHAVLTG